MTSSNPVGKFFAYPSRVIRLDEINVPTAQLKAPSAAQRSHEETRVKVRLVGDRIEPGQALRETAHPLFVFHEGHAENIRKLTEARETNFHNIVGYVARGGAHTAKTGLGGGLLGGLTGALTVLVCPSLGVTYLTGACLGGAGGCAVGTVVGGVEAWKKEGATNRVIDYVLNFNAMFQHALHGRITIDAAADQLHQLYKRRKEAGDAGEMLFEEAYDLIRTSEHPQLKAVTRAFDLLRSRD